MPLRRAGAVTGAEPFAVPVQRSSAGAASRPGQGRGKGRVLTPGGFQSSQRAEVRFMFRPRSGEWTNETVIGARCLPIQRTATWTPAAKGL